MIPILQPVPLSCQQRRSFPGTTSPVSTAARQTNTVHLHDGGDVNNIQQLWKASVNIGRQVSCPFVQPTTPHRFCR